MNSPQKGKRLELEAALALRETLGLPAQRSARRGVAGASDIISLPGLHIEVKGRRRIAALKFLAQAEKDCQGHLPLVLMRENSGDWTVMLRLGGVLGLLDILARAALAEEESVK